MNNSNIIKFVIPMSAVILCGCASKHNTSYSMTDIQTENTVSEMLSEYSYTEFSEISETSEISESYKITEIIESEKIQTDTTTAQTEIILSENITENPVIMTENTTAVMPEETTIPVTSASEMAVTDEISVSIPHPSPNIYGYTPKFYQLNSDEQIIYDKIAGGLILMKPEIDISEVCIDDKQLAKVYSAVMTTIEQQLYNPIRRYALVYDENKQYVKAIKPDYSIPKSKVDEMNNQLSAKADEIISQITPEMTDVDIIKLFHDRIILNCSYSFETENASNAYGALIEGNAACEGYSRAMAYLCGKIGIPCEIITGNANNVYHMWNMVEVDGKWYHIDLTWDDPVFSVEVADYISYDYFNISDTQIFRNHTADTTFFTYPVAYSSDAEYYRYYNHLITGAESAENIIFDGLVSAVSGGYKFAVFKADNDDIFNQTVQLLFGEGWEGFFSIVDRYNAENQIQIDKSNISLKKDADNLTIRISF